MREKQAEMRIFMACPAPPRSRKGNRVTAERWAGIFRALGHRLTIGVGYEGGPTDVLIALHARKSYPAVRDFRRAHPEAKIVVALTGTDLYRDIQRSARAKQSLAWADRLVLLQPCGVNELAAEHRTKARVIFQSAEPVPRPPRRREGVFEVAVLGHLRHEKDPLRAALALRLLPANSRVRVLHAGEALSPGWAQRARAAQAKDARYRWLGEVSRARAQRLLARSRLMVLSSRMEGGANVISEAIVNGVPVLASRIPGSVGLLGETYPGYFPVGDTAALAALLRRVETDQAFYDHLRAACERLRSRFTPVEEEHGWRRLLKELASK
jgi:putative glycosyltransferase (TIGR04348 family)